MSNELKLLTTGDVARVLDVVPPTVLAAANRGQLPVFLKTRRGQRLFRLEDVLRFKEERQK
jgi:excisionase family DNA binding protein